MAENKKASKTSADVKEGKKVVAKSSKPKKEETTEVKKTTSTTTVKISKPSWFKSDTAILIFGVSIPAYLVWFGGIMSVYIASFVSLLSRNIIQVRAGGEAQLNQYLDQLSPIGRLLSSYENENASLPLILGLILVVVAFAIHRMFFRDYKFLGKRFSDLRFAAVINAVFVFIFMVLVTHVVLFILGFDLSAAIGVSINTGRF